MRPWLRTLRTTGIALIVLAVLLIAARAVAPTFVQRYVNRVLDRAEGYDGRIGDVDLSLWRGAYQIEEVDIVKSEGRVPVPLLRSPLVDLSIEWGALFDGALVGEIWLEHPELNFAVGPGGERQTGTETDWRDIVRDLLPFKINRVTVRDGSIHFRAFDTDPSVDVFLSDVDLVANNLTNSEDLSEDMVADAYFTATVMESGRVEAKVAIDPYAELPSFDLDMAIANVSLPQLNDLFRAYAGVDVERGSLRLFTELKSENGRFTGYVKPFFEDVDVISLEELDEQSPLRDLWEAAVGTVAEVFTDRKPEDDRVATRIPISGSVESPDVGFWATLGNVVRNAFVDSFVPALEHSVGEEKG
jgi:hypothetical protein